MDWYPFYPLKHRAKTRHLNFAEQGVYRALIDEYMMTGGPLPDDDKILARIVGATPKEWARFAPAIRAFFTPINGVLRHVKCDEVLTHQKGKSETARQSAQRRWNGTGNGAAYDADA